MKKILLLLTSLVLLTGCINVSIHGAKEDEKTSQTETKEASLTFVRAERYKNQPNEILDLAERRTKSWRAWSIGCFFPWLYIRG